MISANIRMAEINFDLCLVDVSVFILVITFLKYVSSKEYNTKMFAYYYGYVR